jgi:hypothetical protein
MCRLHEMILPEPVAGDPQSLVRARNQFSALGLFTTVAPPESVLRQLFSDAGQTPPTCNEGNGSGAGTAVGVAVAGLVIRELIDLGMAPDQAQAMTDQARSRGARSEEIIEDMLRACDGKGIPTLGLERGVLRGAHRARELRAQSHERRNQAVFPDVTHHQRRPGPAHGRGSRPRTALHAHVRRSRGAASDRAGPAADRRARSLRDECAHCGSRSPEQRKERTQSVVYPSGPRQRERMHGEAVFEHLRLRIPSTAPRPEPTSHPPSDSQSRMTSLAMVTFIRYVPCP